MEYYGDGIYMDPRNVKFKGQSDYWFKVSAGGTVSVESTKNGFQFHYSESPTMKTIANMLGKPYRVGFRPFSDGGAQYHNNNPFNKYFSPEYLKK